MKPPQPIKLREALAQMKHPEPFQIAFYPTSDRLQDFKRISLPQATRCGLPKRHRASRDLVGVKPHIKGKHPYSVYIRLITEFNNAPVVP